MNLVIFTFCKDICAPTEVQETCEACASHKESLNRRRTSHVPSSLSKIVATLLIITISIHPLINCIPSHQIFSPFF